MITFIILIPMIIWGIYLFKKSYDYEGLGLLLIIFGVTYLIIHSLAFGLKSYEYELFVVKREAFVESLNYARENKLEYESMAILKEITVWNQELAEAQYDNKTLFLDQYIDDRVETLKPIK